MKRNAAGINQQVSNGNLIQQEKRKPAVFWLFVSLGGGVGAL
jgi:hypothetical protein